MQIVVDQAETKVQHMLEQVGRDAAGWRCIHLKPKQELALGTAQIQGITSTLKTYLDAVPAAAFFSGLGHVWAIHKSELTPSQAAQLLSQLRTEYDLTTQALEGLYHYDLKISCHEVLAKVERLTMTMAAPKIIKPKIELYEGTMASRLEAFLKEIPPGTAQELAAQRHQRRETVVLAVEDDPFYARLIDKVLSPFARVTLAASADQVMEEYVIAAPDLVLMDIGLPEVSGHQLLQTILKLDPDAYIVMASGNSFKDDVVGAMQSGAKGFITKPFSRDKLIKAINQSPTVRKQIT